MHMPIKTIIFDFGNVIGFFDNRRTIERLAPYSSLKPDEVLAHLVSSKLEDRFERGQLTSTEFIKRGKEIARLDCPDELVVSAWEDIFWANDAVCEFIPRLRPQYRLLLGSNTNELHANFYRKMFARPLAHFDHLVLSHEIGTRKPDPEFFSHCVRNAGCAPQECVFIDDLPANADAASAFGLHAIIYHPDLDLSASLKSLGVHVSDPS